MGRRGKPSQFKCVALISALLPFPPPTMTGCLSTLTSSLSVVNVVLCKSCSCPCSPADAPAELSADSWGKFSVIWNWEVLYQHMGD